VAARAGFDEIQFDYVRFPSDGDLEAIAYPHRRTETKARTIGRFFAYASRRLRPLGVRVSCTDWAEGGWDIEQTAAFARELKQLGCDWIDCSSGGLVKTQKVPVGPGYQVPFAKRIRKETGITSIAIGLITDPMHAERIVAEGDADMVALARGFLWDPRWAWHAATALGATPSIPPQYLRGRPGAV